MIRFIICFIFIHIQISIYSQEKTNGISQIETIDSLLIGKKIKRAIKILDVDTNWTVIHEPPLIAQGVLTSEINGYKVQLITERIPMNKFRRNKSKKMDYSIILRYRIIGVSWEAEGKCRSVGDIIPQYAYDKYGPCNKK
jgi:hypothetical protein